MSLPDTQTVAANASPGAITLPTPGVGETYVLCIQVFNPHATAPVYLTDGTAETTPARAEANSTTAFEDILLQYGDTSGLSLYAPASGPISCKVQVFIESITRS